MPNSLIFVVILAVWAAYLIQHWIRRRDHVATARSVDRFSEAMRVLERRQSMPRADISTPKQRSYSVSLTRPAHPDVVVKRARRGTSSATDRGATRRLRQRPSAPTLRAAALLTGVLALVVGSAVSVVGRSWWGILAGVAALLLAVTFVRFSVESARRRAGSSVRAEARKAAPTAARARAARPAARRPVATRPAATAAAPSRPGRTAHAASPVTREHSADHRAAVPVSARQVAAGRPVYQEVAEVPAHQEVAAGRSRAPELYDVEAVELTGPRTSARVETGAAEAEPADIEPADIEPVAPPAEAAPGTWAPVPVPPPTYTLKARAPRRPEREVPARSERGQRPVDELPFDGHALALDEEFEDLPPVHSVG